MAHPKPQTKALIGCCRVLLRVLQDFWGQNGFKEFEAGLEASRFGFSFHLGSVLGVRGRRYKSDLGCRFREFEGFECATSDISECKAGLKDAGS